MHWKKNNINVLRFVLQNHIVRDRCIKGIKQVTHNATQIHEENIVFFLLFATSR
jgi:hypothetical protein